MAGVRRGLWALNKVLYGEALPRRPNLYPFIYHFLIAKVPLSYAFHRKLYHLHIPTERLLLNFSLEKPLIYSNESAVRCVYSRYFVKYLPFYIPPAWKGYPLQVEPPHIVHYRECPPPPNTIYTNRF